MPLTARFYFSPALVLAVALASFGQARWACIGNSITAGYPQASLAWPPILATKLGANARVQNDGVSGYTLLRKGDKSYWTQKAKFDSVRILQPQYITIELGTNDTKDTNWRFKSEFVANLTSLVDTVQGLVPTAKIFLLLPPPIYPNTYGIDSLILINEVIPKILQVATAKNLRVVDLNTPLQNKRSLFNSDGVHLTNASRDSLASFIYRAYVDSVTAITLENTDKGRNNGGGLRAVTRASDPSPQAGAENYTLDGKVSPATGKDNAAGVYWQAPQTESATRK